MQNVSMQLVKTMEKRDDVELFTIIHQASWRMIGLKTFLFLFTLLWKIPAAIKKHNPDVILFSSMVTAAILPFLLKKPSVPCATINHGQDVTLPVKIYQWYLPIVFRHLDGVISVSEATRRACISRGMKPEKGGVLPNGIHTDVLAELPSKEDARKRIEKEFNINLSGRYILLSVGRQVKRKGHAWFIDNVLPNLESNVIFLIIGDGPEHEKIWQARERAAGKQNILIAGKQPDAVLNAAYAAADLFIMPNIPVEGDMEGFGIVLLEANRAGVPAVAADLEGIKDVIVQGVNGYRVPSGNAEEFAERIDETLKNELKELSLKAREFVINTFSWNSVVDKYVTFLKRLN
ncbi:glycosyltransferase family 4 protein [Rhodohalobacter mucosus]|uniref:Glycosyltransferase family 4 protein n=2 Tax=Rhodohalobacter mucosus TaxID=2079485 RepID=A0A316TTT2_9BACT|nr:glycosyltransferase family 4 protein [Rhodohalobacter mucosus]